MATRNLGVDRRHLSGGDGNTHVAGPYFVQVKGRKRPSLEKQKGPADRMSAVRAMDGQLTTKTLPRKVLDWKIACVVGTRPEAIKMAPVVTELRRFSDLIDTKLVSTGQHREMLAQALGAFGLEPDLDLAIMQHGQTLAEVTARALAGSMACSPTRSPILCSPRATRRRASAPRSPASIARFRFGHVEAGLRTNTIDNPFPEEFNRRAAGLITRLHFPPTAWARDNLLREGVDPTHIFVTGNTGSTQYWRPPSASLRRGTLERPEPSCSPHIGARTGANPAPNRARSAAVALCSP